MSLYRRVRCNKGGSCDTKGKRHSCTKCGSLNDKAVWHYKLFVCGQKTPLRGSTGQTLHTLAEEQERRIRRQAEVSFAKTGRVDARTAPLTFAEAAIEWLGKRASIEASTRDTYGFALKHLKAAFGSKVLGDIDSKAIAAYQQSRIEAGAAGATVNKEFTVLASILADHGLWSAIRRDVKRLEENESAGRALLPDEEARLLQAASQTAQKQGHWSAIYTVTVLGLNTGLRHSEVRKRRWADVDLQKRVLIVGKTKTEAGSGRPVPLTPAAHAVLDMWASRFPNRKPSDYVFPGCENGRIDASRPVAHWRTAWNNACDLAGLPGLRYHDLRHSAATKLLENGVPFAVVAQVLGWAASTAIRMSKRYGHIRPEAQRKALEGINTPLPEPVSPERKGTLTGIEEIEVVPGVVLTN